MITSVHHIAIIVSSERSLDFYRLLGFRETLRKIRDYDMVVLMENESAELVIFIDPSHSEHPTDDRELPIGVRHIALTTSDFDEEVERLRLAGLDVGEVDLDWRGQRYVFIKDFDGITVELHE
ncbi:MAG: VOC family protein [Lachnospiraceae bacterium]|nr:VOC family protein [Lachnospiraceae bacterium]